MAYVQTIGFDTTKGGTTPNFCLSNVCSGFGIPNKYDSAWEAWLHTQQHAGEPPAGLDVPVFFSYTATIDGTTANWGHIGVRLASGQFWSDGRLYTNIQAYEANHTPAYVGWGESVNDFQVIKEEDDMVPDENHLNALFRAFRLRNATSDEVANNVGKVSYTALVEQLDSGDERTEAVDAADTGEKAIKEDWVGYMHAQDEKIASLQKQLDQATAASTTAAAQPTPGNVVTPDSAPDGNSQTKTLPNNSSDASSTVSQSSSPSGSRSLFDVIADFLKSFVKKGN